MPLHQDRGNGLMALLSSRSIKRPGPAHEIILFEVNPVVPEPLRPWWEMHCSCGAWMHGNKEQVEHVAAVHRVETGEPAP